MNEQRMRVLLIEENPGDTRLAEEMLSESHGPAFETQGEAIVRARLLPPFSIAACSCCGIAGGHT
jgi:hypothetical protein